MPYGRDREARKGAAKKIAAARRVETENSGIKTQARRTKETTRKGQVGLKITSKCHSERSEESRIKSASIQQRSYTEMFRFAQHNSAIYEMSSSITKADLVTLCFSLPSTCIFRRLSQRHRAFLATRFAPALLWQNAQAVS